MSWGASEQGPVASSLSILAGEIETRSILGVSRFVHANEDLVTKSDVEGPLVFLPCQDGARGSLLASLQLGCESGLEPGANSRRGAAARPG